MILNPVDYIPEIPSTRNNKHDLYELLDSFAQSGIRYAKVDYDNGEYTSRYYARVAIHKCIKTNKFPIVVRMRNGSLYLEHIES